MTPLAVATVIGVCALVLAAPALAASKEKPESPPPPPSIYQGTVATVTASDLVVRSDSGETRRFVIGRATAVLRDGKPILATGIFSGEPVWVNFTLGKYKYGTLVRQPSGKYETVDKERFFAARIRVGSGADAAAAETAPLAGTDMPNPFRGTVRNITANQIMVSGETGKEATFIIGIGTRVLRDGKAIPATAIFDGEPVQVAFSTVSILKKKRLLASLIAVGNLSSGAAQSKPGGTRGRVRNITAGELLIAAETGLVVKFAIDADTKILREGKPITVGGVVYNEPVFVESTMVKSVRGKRAIAVKIHLENDPLTPNPVKTP
jgi:hypothetical protein